MTNSSAPARMDSRNSMMFSIVNTNAYTVSGK